MEMKKKIKCFFHFIERKTQILISTLTDKTTNRVYWSPNGKFSVLATTKRSAGLMEFWNIDSMEIISTSEHFMCTDCEWDPTSRYFTTSVSQYRHQSENGFIIWNFMGQIQNRLKIEKFWQFTWRPRPISLLSTKDEENIRKNFNEKKI